MAADNPTLCVRWCRSTKDSLWRVTAKGEGTVSGLGDREAGGWGVGLSLGAGATVVGPGRGVYLSSADTLPGLGSVHTCERSPVLLVTPHTYTYIHTYSTPTRPPPT